MLYIVATPIGNLDEITLRAIDVLRSVDIIAAEDTRHTALLLKRHGITARTVAYHKFNERVSAEGLIKELKAGKNIAVVSDAGMPTVSDPGHILIDEAIKAGIDFTVISGPTAAIDALVLSGLDTRSFCVLGFLPEKNTDRQRFIEPYLKVPGTLIFYSAVYDIKKDLEFLYRSFGPRDVAVCREMTKMYETVTRGVLGEPLDIVEKGEFAIAVAGFRGEKPQMTVEEQLIASVKAGADTREAVKTVAAERGIPKSEVYRVAVEIKDKLKQS